MSCPNLPDEGTAQGICHTCAHRERLPWWLGILIRPGQGRKVQRITFCGGCCHWFCEDCRLKVLRRFLGWADEKVRGLVEGCCGPEGA